MMHCSVSRQVEDSTLGVCSYSVVKRTPNWQSVLASVQVSWLINDVHTVKAAEGLVLLLWFEKRGDIFAWPHLLLPPGKLSVFVVMALWGDAEHTDVQVSSNL